MRILPLDHPEPFAATLGVMLYPNFDEEDRRKARSFAVNWLAEPVRRLREIGIRLSQDTLERLVMDAGAQLPDVAERWEEGLSIGELFTALYILAKHKPKLASWESAIKIYELSAKRAGLTGTRTDLHERRRRFLSVTHLWAAWCIRGNSLNDHPELEYDQWTDFQYFLAETEILRDFGQTWRPSRAKAEPPLPSEVWRVPLDWKPPPRRPGWPNTGMIPNLALPDDLMEDSNRQADLVELAKTAERMALAPSPSRPQRQKHLHMPDHGRDGGAATQARICVSGGRRRRAAVRRCRGCNSPYEHRRALLPIGKTVRGLHIAAEPMRDCPAAPWR